jgi:Uma2 family endonuclease
MSDDEKRVVVEALPSRVPLELQPPEGDPHRKAKSGAIEALQAFFKSQGRRIYISGELAVYYPNEPRISPDLFAVLDVDDHERDTWVVNAEGKGLDWVLEVVYLGDYKKDAIKNVDTYARLGIREYFIFDRRELMLSAYRLPSGEPRYVHVLPRAGRYESSVLGLSVGIDGSRLRFYAGTAALPESEERIAKLTELADALIERRDKAEADRLEAEATAQKERERTRVAALMLLEAGVDESTVKERLGLDDEAWARLKA